MQYQPIPAKTALLIIDAQREYFDPGRPLYTPHAERILQNLVRLRNVARSAGATVIIVQHEHAADGSDVGRMGDFDPTPVFVAGTPGVEVLPQLSPRDGEQLLRKTRYSAFAGTDLEERLRLKGIDTVIVTGLMTNFCCVTTARHAHDLDYKAIFVADAVAGPDMPDLGYGAVPHAEVLRVVATSLAGGVAEVVNASTLLDFWGGSNAR